MREHGPEFKYYVLNYDFNSKSVEMFNIFRNIHVYENTLRLCEKLNKGIITWESYFSELDNIIKWQEWGRREYEISVGDAFETDLDKFEKWDCYTQAHANIEIIGEYVYSQYMSWIGE